MNEMWQVVKGAGLPTTGINHWVYLPDGRMFRRGSNSETHKQVPTSPICLSRLEFEFAAAHESMSTSGHIKYYLKNGKDLKAELAVRGELIGSPSLEIYGHHCDEPSNLETTILIGLQTRST